MALPVLSSSGVRFRRVLAHFPQELSLAFAYGSGVFRQEGASAGHSEVSAADGWAGAGRCGRGPRCCGRGGGRPSVHSLPGAPCLRLKHRSSENKLKAKTSPYW
uniref:Phosphatidate cytidylyltransferase n=1 Tax=Meleagris gallopavo TaxID=9103 RepID=A0A803YF10_MELGA